MTHTNSTPANPIPPGWPDPLESPQAEAIRNGMLDDTEIRNLFDCMERELRLHRERAANPAQVTDALDADKIATWPALKKALWDVVTFEQLNDGHYINAYDLTDKLHFAVTAAIGAGNEPFQLVEESDEVGTQMVVARALTHPAPSGQAVAEGLHLTEYEIQVLLGTSIHGCNMSPDRVFSLDMAWHRLHALDLIDRTDGLAIVTEKGERVIATILSAAPKGE